MWVIGLCIKRKYSSSKKVTPAEGGSDFFVGVFLGAACMPHPKRRRNVMKN